MDGLYILDDAGNPVAVTDLNEWGRWRDTHERHVAETIVGDGQARISTIFLGLDYRLPRSLMAGPSAPILFETKIFGGPLNQEQVRYCTRDEAVAGHAAMAERVRQAMATREPEG